MKRRAAISTRWAYLVVGKKGRLGYTSHLIEGASTACGLLATGRTVPAPPGATRCRHCTILANTETRP